MLHTSEEICEALVRYVECSGEEVFEKSFVQDGKVLCTVWCVIGEHAETFRAGVSAWLATEDFKLDN